MSTASHQPLNQLLACLPDEERARLMPFLERVHLPTGQSLCASTHCANGADLGVQPPHTVEKALSRCLLLCLDRSPGNELLLTHEQMANVLGVRREGVSEAASRLQRQGLIRYARGHIEVLDRPGLAHSTCECYDVIKTEYDRLLPMRLAV